MWGVASNRGKANAKEQGTCTGNWEEGHNAVSLGISKVCVKGEGYGEGRQMGNKIQGTCTHRQKEGKGKHAAWE